MNKNDLKKLIDKGENETVEFKKSFQRDVIESVVAFANAKGGRVLIGISDTKKISGVLLSSETLKEWLNQIKNSTYPSLLPEIEAHTIHGKNIVEITVSEHPI